MVAASSVLLPGKAPSRLNNLIHFSASLQDCCLIFEAMAQIAESWP